MNLFLAPVIGYKLFDKTDYTSLTYILCKVKVLCTQCIFVRVVLNVYVCICVFVSGEVGSRGNGGQKIYLLFINSHPLLV